MRHQGTADLLTEGKNRAREPNLRSRKSLDEIVFAGTFGTPAKLALETRSGLALLWLEEVFEEPSYLAKANGAINTLAHR